MSKYQGALIGLAIGDAMGVSIEFSIREKFLKNPLTEMIGFGSHNVPAGSWSDDTSMTIATMDSIIEKGEIDYTDIMNKYCEWAVDYGVPQTRKRYFLVAILDNDKEFKFIDGKGGNKTLLDYYIEKNTY